MVYGKNIEDIVPIKKKDKRNYNICLMFLVIFCIMFVWFGYKTIKYFVDNNKTNKVIKEINELAIVDNVDQSNNTNQEQTEEVKTEQNFGIDFEALKSINPDIVSYIQVLGTDINYSVVKGVDNEYYLFHNFYKEYDLAGWPFADYENKMNGTDKNIIIYAHNMKNGTMFATLKNVFSEEWQKNKDNRYITYITEDEKATYEIYSIYKVENEDYYRKVNFDDNEFLRFIEVTKERSLYNFGVDLSLSDKILTLSTCDTNNKYRVVVHAKKIVNKEEK